MGASENLGLDAKSVLFFFSGNRVLGFYQLLKGIYYNPQKS